MDKFFRDKPPKKYQYGLLDLGDHHIFDHAGIDLEASYGLILAAADDKAEFAFVGLWHPELLVKEPFVEAVLVELRTILVPYDEVEKRAPGIDVGDVEYNLVVLYSQVLDGG